MAGLNIAAIKDRNEANPDPVLDLFLRQVRLSRIIEQTNALMCEAYDLIGDMDAIREQVAAKMAEGK